jgi:hypothetical protein
MADQGTGGDGSVYWSIDADNVKDHSTSHNEDGSLHQHGVDKSGTPGEPFTITIKVPEGVSVEQYLRGLCDPASVWAVRPVPGVDRHVYFNIPIEGRTHDQIRVSWGKSTHVIRPTQNK